MCLSVMTEVEQRQVLKSLPKVFPCWKAMKRNGDCEFHESSREPMLERRNTYTAGKFGYRRSNTPYIPGYHAFIDRGDAVQHANARYLVVVKFWGKKSDIITVGRTWTFSHPVCVVLKKIMRK